MSAPPEQNATIALDQGAVLDDTKIKLDAFDAIGTYASTTGTLGAGAAVTVTGGNASFSARISVSENEGTITIAKDSELTVLDQGFTNTGSIFVEGGTLAIDGNVTAPGAIILDVGSVIELTGLFDVSALESFSPGSGVLSITGTLNVGETPITPGEGGVPAFDGRHRRAGLGYTVGVARHDADERRLYRHAGQ